MISISSSISSTGEAIIPVAPCEECTYVLTALYHQTILRLTKRSLTCLKVVEVTLVIQVIINFSLNDCFVFFKGD